MPNPVPHPAAIANLLNDFTTPIAEAFPGLCDMRGRAIGWPAEALPGLTVRAALHCMLVAVLREAAASGNDPVEGWRELALEGERRLGEFMEQHAG